MTAVSREEALRLQAKAMSEKDLQAHVVAAAKAHGWRHVYHTFDSRRSAAGYPDLTILRGMRGLVMELKREGKDATDEQYGWLHAFSQTGYEAYVFTPSDWLSGEIEKILS